MFKLLLELGVVFTTDYARYCVYFLHLDNCIELMDLIGIKQCGDMLYRASEKHLNGFLSDESFIKVIDRCYPTNDIRLPLFARTFLITKEWAQLGAIHTIHALKKMIGKDAARIIARVIWAERKNYHLSRPNKK